MTEQTEETTDTEGALPGTPSTGEGPGNRVPTDPADHATSDQNGEPETFPRDYVV
jgi:hypothetical protein